MSIPTTCKRTKSISVSEDFITALSKACEFKKAERLPEDSFLELYVGHDVLRNMDCIDNQIIWGRRGTGKTHLLNAFTQKINNDPESNKMAFYISLDNIAAESPIDLTFSSDEEKMKYYSRKTFVTFVSALVEQIIASYESILSCKYFYNEYSNEYRREKTRRIENALVNLLESCTYGKINGINRVKEVTQTSVVSNGKEGSIDFGSQIETPSISKPNMSMRIQINKKKENSEKVEKIETIKENFSYAVSMAKIKSAVEKVVSALEIETLFICLDELWLIDHKREISFQPLFLELLRQSFFSIGKISFKIASIREVTKLNSKASAANTYGLQSGHDIIELLNFDTLHVSEIERYNYYSQMLLSRINYFLFLEKEKSRSLISPNNYVDKFDENFMISSIFKEKRYFLELISSTHAIPRTFLIVLQRCLNIIDYNLSKYFLHSYLIRQEVINSYLNDKRSSIPMNSSSLFNIISKYINDKLTPFFLLSSEQIKRFRIEVDNLIYTEIIHQIPSCFLPADIMDEYKGFYIDSGKYYYTLSSQKTRKINREYSFSYELSESITSNISDYIIDVDNIDSEFIECPNCGARISMQNPVYKKAHICYICAFSFDGEE